MRASVTPVAGTARAVVQQTVQIEGLPLHDQIRPWAMRKCVTTVHRADDRPMPTWTTIK
mgnify:CR=1 FL=1